MAVNKLPESVMQYYWKGNKEGFLKAKQQYEQQKAVQTPEVTLPEVTITPNRQESTWTSEDINNPVYKKEPKTIHIAEHQFAPKESDFSKAIGLVGVLGGVTPVTGALLEGTGLGLKEVGKLAKKVVPKVFKQLDYMYTPSKWINPFTGNTLFGTKTGLGLNAALYSKWGTEGLSGLYNQYKNRTLGNVDETVSNALLAAPIVGAGYKLTTKLVNNFNRAQKAAKTQIVAKAFDNQVKNTIPKITVSEINPIIYTPETNTSKTSLAFFERPSKLTLREKIGAPKGTKVYTPEENITFRQQINDFARKYGYEPIGQETTDPEVLERYARPLIKRHNTYYRGVEGVNDKQKLVFATNPPGGGSGELYITPYENVASMYGDPVEILRPYKLGSDRTKWFDEGNFKIASAGGQREMENFKKVKGIVDPWTNNKYLLLYQTVPTELTGRNQQFIPLRIRHRVLYGDPDWKYSDNWYQGVGSLNRATVTFTPNVQFKQGGKLNDIN